MSTKTDEILESLKTLSLLEASELVKQIEDAFGVSAAPSAGVVMAAPGAAGAAVVAGVLASSASLPQAEKTRVDPSTTASSRCIRLFMNPSDISSVELPRLGWPSRGKRTVSRIR